jgi:uncharacterized protein YndB with AHSA1/START domain
VHLLAPVRFELSCLVRADREELFSFLEGDERAPGVERRDGELRMRLWIPLRGPASVAVEVLEREWPVRLAYRWTLGRNVEGELEYVLHPEPYGTRLHHGVSMRADRSLGVVRPLLRRALHAAAERRLRRICQLCPRLDGRAAAPLEGALVGWTAPAQWTRHELASAGASAAAREDDLE